MIEKRLGIGLRVSQVAQGNPPRQCRRHREAGSVPGWRRKAVSSSILAWEMPWTEEPGGYSP